MNSPIISVFVISIIAVICCLSIIAVICCFFFLFQSSWSDNALCQSVACCGHCHNQTTLWCSQLLCTGQTERIYKSSRVSSYVKWTPVGVDDCVHTWIEEDGNGRGFQASNHPASSASRITTIVIPHTKKTHEEWLPCSPQKLKHGNGKKDWWIVIKTFKISSGACSLIMRDISCSQIE